MPGFGVCQTIIDAFSPTQPVQAIHSQAHHIQANSQHQQHQSSHEQAAIQPAPALMANDHSMPHAAIDPVLPAHSVDHHFSHLSCGFCTLYGHAIPPPNPQPLWSPIALTVYVTLPRFSYFAVPALTPDYIKPQSRAPPADYIA